MAFVNEAFRNCLGKAAIQVSDTKYACNIDLRDCPGNGLGPRGREVAEDDLRLVFNLVSTAGPGVAATELIRSPPLQLRRQLRLATPDGGGFFLPTGLAQGATLFFGREGLSNLEAGKSFCRLEDSLRTGVAELASLGALDGQFACTFSSGQLERLSSQGSEPEQFKLLLSNNVNAGLAPGLGPDDDYDGLQNWYDPELDVDILDSPFFKSDAVLDLIEPRAVFHNRNSTIQFRASSRQTSETASFERYGDLRLQCSLYDLDVSSISARWTQPCRFSSTRMDTIELRLDSGVLKSGSYHLQVGLAEQSPSKVLDSKHLRILFAPRLDSVYPRHVSLEGFAEDFGAIYLVGLGFQGLTEVEGSLRCMLAAEINGNVSAILLASQNRRAEVLSDTIAKCPLSRSAIRRLSEFVSVPSLVVRPRLVLSSSRGSSPDK